MTNGNWLEKESPFFKGTGRPFPTSCTTCDPLSLFQKVTVTFWTVHVLFFPQSYDELSAWMGRVLTVSSNPRDTNDAQMMYFRIISG